MSVVIPVLNEAATIQATLSHLAPMRSRGVEIVVVDGGSSDDTVPLAAPLADQVITAPRGRAAQMNAGAAIAGGNVLWFLHADTIPPNDADEIIARSLMSSLAQWGRFDVCIVPASVLLRVVARMMNLRSRLSGIATGDQAIFVRREAFEAVGRFPNIPLMEDIALSTRLNELSPPICLSEKVETSARRWQKHGTIRTILLMWRLRLSYSLGVDPADLAVRYGYPAPQPPPASGGGDVSV